MLSLLPRYENKYFNCIQSQIVSYCKHIDFPIEWLFYNSYERTGALVEQFIHLNKSRWLYEGECLNPDDLSLLNITLHQTQVGAFDEVDQLLMKLTDRGDFVIITCDLFDLPYKKLHYRQLSVKHRFIYIGREKHEDGNKHLVLDDNSSAMGDFTLRVLHDDLLRETFDRSDKRVFWLDFQTPPNEEELRDRIGARLKERVACFSDDLMFYDEVPKLINDDDPFNYNSGGILDRLINAFTLIAGSRNVFSRFLNFYGNYTEAEPIFTDCSLKAEIITNMLVKFKISQKIDILSLKEKCMRLKESEYMARDRLSLAVGR